MAEPWAPSMTDVGARIPTKTRDQTQPGNDNPAGTFNDTTVPTADEVEPIVEGAVAQTRAAVASIPEALYGLANDAAAWRAAADIELAWPERNAQITDLYTTLDARAKLALQQLIDACDDAGTGADGGRPVYAFPEPVPWGDTYL
ncbi:hypothetical protein [Actinomadura litoris]|uniref:Uncharacterized protein n=1 Tax=Actinomadura litoris TaxID=2678616 RepID=A0A7K1LAF8_9ACTN|nr:hypothetical protein [Actinomadura litoris]MUN41408.1 hypothetical protein [Actinomadura litoris]